MTEIQVLIPLSVFGDSENLTPQAISTAIQQAADSKSKIAELQQKLDQTEQNIRDGGKALLELWENQDTPYVRAQKIRAFTNQMIHYGEEE